MNVFVGILVSYLLTLVVLCIFSCRIGLTISFIASLQSYLLLNPSSLIYQVFRKGELKLTDDPSSGYTAGDSVCDNVVFLTLQEIKNIMVNNPAVAQKVLQGAVKLSANN